MESPDTPLEYATGLVPDPRFVPPEAGALVPNVSSQDPGFIELYLNQPVAVSPLGSAVPFSVTVEVEILDSVFVVTVGGDGP